MRYHEMIERPANKANSVIDNIMDHTNGFWSLSSSEEHDDISLAFMETPPSTPPSTPPPLLDDDDDESVFSMDLHLFDDHPLNSSFDRSGNSTFPTTIIDTVAPVTPNVTTTGCSTPTMLPDVANNPVLGCSQQEDDTEWYCDPLFSTVPTSGGMLQVPAIFGNHHAIMLQRPCCIVNNNLSGETGRQATMFQSCPRCILSFALCFMTKLTSPHSSGCLSIEDSLLAVEIMAALYSRMGCPPCCQQDVVGDVTNGGGGGGGVTDSEEPSVVSGPGKATSPMSKRRRRKDPIKKIYVNKTDKDVLFGRGRSCNNHPGNKMYLQLIRASKEKYKRLTTSDAKTELSNSIVKFVQKMGGRFLKQEGGGVGEGDHGAPAEGLFYIVADNTARLKVSQALRDDCKTRSKEAKIVIGEKSHCQIEESTHFDVMIPFESTEYAMIA